MNATPEISPTPNYWDGESIIIGSWDRGDGLPAMIPPADHQSGPETNVKGPSLTTIVENLEADLA